MATFDFARSVGIIPNLANRVYSSLEGRSVTCQPLHDLDATLGSMLYALRTMSTHHSTCLQPPGKVCNALRQRLEALSSALDGRPERVNLVVPFARKRATS